MDNSLNLPINTILPELRRLLNIQPNVVLIAPPGAGKTTGVPLALLGEAWRQERRILMLEPRRVAARAAAERMASVLGESVGKTIGYTIRRESSVSDQTKIEVITEGILTRRLQRDPSLENIAAVIFDEYHERSIHADLGLALCLDAQGALREDIRLIVMSATLDGEAVGAIMGNAPTVRSEGKAFSVQTRWLDTPWKRPNSPRDAFEQAVANCIAKAMSDEGGDVLVFLPGVREISRVQGILTAKLPKETDVRPLHGAMPFAKQRAAIAPREDGGRRVVLATAIAETSLTIQGVRIVVDGGLARNALFDAGAGMTRLITRKVSRASAVQRQGRAGRTEPGVCYRLWTKGEEGGLNAANLPEIAEADLTSLALDLAVWGIRDPASLRWLDQPPQNTYEQARMLLMDLGALQDDGRPTDHGKLLAEMPLHPRLAHLLVKARALRSGRSAAELAAILDDRDPLRGEGSDIRLRIDAIRNSGAYQSNRDGVVDYPTIQRIRETAKALIIKDKSSTGNVSLGSLIALAYPDRIAKRAKGGSTVLDVKRQRRRICRLF